MRIATKSSKLNISKLENTKKIADIFAKNIFKGNVILFYGEIGVGKTTFIKSLVNSLEKIDKKKNFRNNKSYFQFDESIQIKQIWYTSLRPL